MANVERDEFTGTNTTGHEWDGIKELDTPMPRWWLLTYYACIVWAIGYWVVYPSWPMLSDHWKGTSEYTDRKGLVDELALRDVERAVWYDKFTAMDVNDIAKDNELLNFAMAGGKVIFGENCSACHGSQGSGAPGYPILADDDWIWGGSLTDIETTVRYGVRSAHDDTRASDMPVFSDDNLDNTQIADTAEYVLSLSNRHKDNGAAERGEDVFEEECAACHGEDGEGIRDSGGPRLSDGIWLYGSELESIVSQISTPRHGVMPTWEGRLDDVSIKQVSIYVHSLGGGE